LLLAPRFFFDILSKLFKNMVLLKSEGLTSPVEQTVAPSQSFQQNKRHTIPATNPGDEERDEYHTEKEVDEIKREGTDEPIILEAIERRKTPVEQMVALNSKLPGSGPVVLSKSTSRSFPLHKRPAKQQIKPVDEGDEPTILEAVEQLIFPPHIFPRTTNDDDAKSKISNKSTAFCFHSTLDETYPEVNSLGEAFRSIDFFCCKEGACSSSTVASTESNRNACHNIFQIEFPSINRNYEESCSTSSFRHKGELCRVETESFEDEDCLINRHSPSTPVQRRSVREVYADIRDLQHDRLTAQPEMLVDIDLALEVLRDELRSISNATRAANNNAEGEDDNISICDSISSIHQSISKIQINANENFSAIAEQNRALAQSVQAMQQQMAMLTYPVPHDKDLVDDDEVSGALFQIMIPKRKRMGLRLPRKSQSPKEAQPQSCN
jgi:hypothetical protein